MAGVGSPDTGSCAMTWSSVHRAMFAVVRRRLATAASTLRDAHCVLWELQSPAPLLVDPYTPLLLDEQTATPDAASSLADVVAVRTRAIDSWLEKPSWPPVRTTRRQIVLLNAAYDTRAYRLGLGQSMRIFEVDADASLLSRKREVLSARGFAPRTAVVDVAADPHDCSDALLAAGFDPRIPTRWVLEAPVASAAASRQLFAMASELASTPASGLAAQVLEPSWAAHLATLGLPSPPADDSATLEAALDDCRAAGWREKRTWRRPDFEAAYKRSPHEAFALIFAEADSDP